MRSTKATFWGLVAVGMTLASLYLLIAGGDVDIGQRDAPEYGGVAVSISAGDGLTVPFGEPGLKQRLDRPDTPLVFFPPGVSTLISVPVLFGVDWLTAASVLQAMAIGLGTVLTVWVLLTSGASTRVAVIGGLAYLATLLRIADGLGSEAFMMPVVIGGIWASWRYQTSSRPVYLIVAAVLVAVATMFRFAGVALFATVILAVLMTETTPVRRLKVAGMASLSLLPVGAWLLYSSRAAEVPGGLSWHPPSLSEWRGAASSLSAWLVPLQVPVALRVALAVLLGTVISVFVVRMLRAGASKTPTLALGLAAFGTAHLVVLGATVTFLVGQAGLITRQLAPSMLTLLLAVLLLDRWWILTPVLVSSIAMGAQAVEDLRSEAGFSEEPWVTSEALQSVSALPDSAPVFSNAPDGIWVATGRSSWSIPAVESPWTLRSNDELGSQLNEMIDLVAVGGGVVVLFDGIERPYLVDEDHLLSRGLSVVWRTDEAVGLAP